MATRAELIRQDKRQMLRSMALAEDAVNRVLPDLSTLPQQEAGQVVRTIAVGTVDQFGTVATTAAAESYNRLRELGINDALANLLVSRGRADAYLARPIAVAAPTRVEGAIGATMQKFSQGAFVEAQAILARTVGRAVGIAYRETMTTNVERDPRGGGFQRVASPTACAFCLTVALNTYTSFEQSGGYHNACGCSTVPIFDGQEPYRPDYYDQFQEIYAQAGVDAQSSDATQIFAAIRQATGRR